MRRGGTDIARRWRCSKFTYMFQDSVLCHWKQNCGTQLGLTAFAGPLSGLGSSGWQDSHAQLSQLSALFSRRWKTSVSEKPYSAACFSEPLCGFLRTGRVHMRFLSPSFRASSKMLVQAHLWDIVASESNTHFAPFLCPKSHSFAFTPKKNEQKKYLIE